MYIKLPDIYPYYVSQLRKDNPQTSFPENIPTSLLERYGVYEVQPTEMPQGDIVEELPPALIDGVWTQQWSARDYTAEELTASIQTFRDTASVTPRQARLALLQNGITEADIQAVIDTISEPEKSAVKIEWEYALDIRRNHAWVASLGLALGLSDTQLDSLFELAGTL